MTNHPVKRRQKQIEVAIPLEAIHVASARDVIFCQMVDAPSAVPEEFPTEKEQEIERLRLFALISTDHIGGVHRRLCSAGPLSRGGRARTKVVLTLAGWRRWQRSDTMQR